MKPTVLPAALLFLLVFLPSCTTTLNHGTALDAGKSAVAFRSPLTLGGNSLDYQYGLTNDFTLGVAARGLMFPGGEVYGLYGVETEFLDAAMTAGVLVDPMGYDRKGDLSTLGPWVSPTMSLAFSKEMGAFRPFSGASLDYWKAAVSAGFEWKLGQLKLFLETNATAYYHDYGPVSSSGQGIVIVYHKGSSHLSVIPGISWEF